MKRLLLVSIILCCFISSCGVIGPCDQVSEKQVIFLIDVTDGELFETIDSDIKAHFSPFMKNNRLAEINECERFTFSVGHLSGLESLEIQSASIQLTTKGESLKKQQSLKNPSGIGVLLKSKLSEFSSLTSKDEYTSGSFIANQILKAANETELNGSNYVFVFSDLIENNKYLNMYKKDFDFSQNPDICKSIIESNVLKTFKSNQESGKHVKIILVQKEEPNGKVDRREIRAFWNDMFTHLEMDYTIIDNLSQNIAL